MQGGGERVCPGPGPLSTGETRGHEASQLAIFPRNLPDPGRRLSLGAKEGPGLLEALDWGWGSLKERPSGA